jgi:hypothetical protein
MELLRGFWSGMAQHLWQCTLILGPLFLLARLLERAPARALRSIVYRIGAAVLFFYPLLYPILRRLQSTAEFECDECVIQSGISIRAYSSALAHAVRLDLSPCVSTSAAAARSSSGVVRRVKHLTTINTARLTMSAKHRIAVGLAALMVAAGTLYPLPMRAVGDKPSATGKDTSVTTVEDNNPPPVLLKTATPKYPSEAREYGFTANVVLKIIVNHKGEVEKAEVRDASVISPKDKKSQNKKVLEKKSKEIYTMFTEAALEAVYKFTFAPVTRDGKPSRTTALIPIKFRLE